MGSESYFKVKMKAADSRRGTAMYLYVLITAYYKAQV